MLLNRNQLPRLVGTRPPSGLCIVLMQTLFNICRDPEVVFPRRNAAERVNKILQKTLEPLTRIELVTFRYGRSTNLSSAPKLWSR